MGARRDGLSTNEHRSFIPLAASLTLSDARANLNVPLNGTERIE